uniref:Putative secreted protein n=1 Tax=Amblyomma triste TaxID=251400 RepID=A0A023G2U7_AMBTT
MHRRIIALILLGGCAWASVTRLNFAVDERLNRVEVDVLPLPETSFDVENNWTFSGFIGFHLENGTVRNLHRRVQRQGDCKMHEAQSGFMPFECRFRIRGLVAKYDVEMNVEERLSIWKGVEVHVVGGDLFMEMVAKIYSTCTDQCTRITNAPLKIRLAG